MSFIDLHQHFLYGIDDGPKEASGMEAMLRLAAENGIIEIAATAHCLPGYERFPMENYLQRLEEARKLCREREIPLRLHSGMEIFYTESTPRLLREGRLLPLGESRNLLLEFSPRAEFENLCEAARQISEAGYGCVFAHIERYSCLRKPERIEYLRNNYNVRMQINARTILEPGGFFGKQWLKKVLKEELADLIASDAHDVQRRKCCMKSAWEKILQDYGVAYVEHLFCKMPKRVLKK